MRIVDLHADVLCKLLENPGIEWKDPKPGERTPFDATPGRLRQAGVSVQVFPLFLPEELQNPEALFHGAELFWSDVLAKQGFKLIRSAADLAEAGQQGRIGALFSLEGVGALQGKMWMLRLLHRLGLRLLGPTWNGANWACDGALEPRGGGFTKAGRQLITECENLGILLDVSHLSDRGFWELAERATRPFLASHSNARSIVDHPRNLTDEQIRALIAADGLIGITFVPWFAAKTDPARIEDVLRHIDHMCALGGEQHVALGSDFDGISSYVQGLEHPGCYPDLIEAMLKRYPETFVRGILEDNAIRYLTTNLPN
ncbi:dipeptidase [Cohnella sp. LGH]|uniref:dipeptidase n=1 Tax=unclassified Cohnella TaxID=2636738 RepID=UPI001ADC5647|nr:dipeptidase [Cohnella sp. LGH]QTH45830.1 dipeptidase [Cohnella sp. LGH]